MGILSHSARPRPESTSLLEDMPADQRVAFTILVRPHDKAPALPDLDYWQRTPFFERKFPTPEEHAKMYGSSAEDVEAITGCLRRQGMTILNQSAGARTVTVEASAAQIKSTFGVGLKYFEARHPLAVLHERNKTPGDFVGSGVETHHGYDGVVSLPPELEGRVVHVIGLDNRSILVPGGATGDPMFSGSLRVTDIAAWYNFPPPSADGHTLGIFNASGSFLRPDISKYFSQQPDGYKLEPTLVEVPMTVGSTHYQNYPGDVPLGSLETYEITQDIMTAATIAQGCTINVYFTEQTEQGWLVFLRRLLNPGPESQPQVVSMSWTTLDELEHGTLFKDQWAEVAAAGITVFGISGDWGADNDVGDGKAHIGAPGSDPSVTCCGGTIVGFHLQRRTGPVQLGVPMVESVSDEYAWSEGGGGSTGGGMSVVFPTPGYQLAAGISEFKDSTSTVRKGGRFTPDVSGHVAYKGFILNGLPFDFMGVSCVAPLYAGLFTAYKSDLAIDRYGPLNPTLYYLGAKGSAAFNDVTYGTNDPVVRRPVPYFSAQQGFDPTTGWGSINGTVMLRALGVREVRVGGNVVIVLGGVDVDGGGVIIYPGGHVVPIDPWTGRVLNRTLTASQAMERLGGAAKVLVAEQAYREIQQLTESALKNLGT
ncbi:putative serine protease [Ilyonectria destructans]|nr:putative serine protease [Ilyonectria destructans]